MSKPALVERIGAWALTRWEYDGAPLEAEHDDGFALSVDKDGDLNVDDLPDYRRHFHVPVAVIERLIADARARGVLK